MFSHRFGVDKIIVGFHSSIKTFSDNNIQKESTGNGPPSWYGWMTSVPFLLWAVRCRLYGILRSVTALKSSVTFVL